MIFRSSAVSHSDHFASLVEQVGPVGINKNPGLSSASTDKYMLCALPQF